MNEWQNQGGRASGPPPQAVRDFQRAQGQARDVELRAKGYGPAVFKAHVDLGMKPARGQTKLDLVYDAKTDKWVTIQEAKAAAKKVQPTRDEMKAAVKAGKSLHALMPSTCLQSLTYKDGVATAEFYRGGAVVYDYEMSLEEFIDWAESGSLGKYGNENVF